MILKLITTDLRNLYYKNYSKSNKISFQFKEVITPEQVDELSKFMKEDILKDAISALENKKLFIVNQGSQAKHLCGVESTPQRCFIDNKYNNIAWDITKSEQKIEENISKGITTVTKEVIEILKIHTKDGGFLVGGCVRDSLLGLKPKDYDFTTATSVYDLIEPFESLGFKTDKVGLAFSVLIVSKNGEQFEIANFRKDSESSDGRKPNSVEIGTLEDDAERRDFTINSLFFSLKDNKLIDPTRNGLQDFFNRTLKFVGKPQDRLKEDRLRAFRFYRFIDKTKPFGFKPDSKSLKAVRESINISYNLFLKLEKQVDLINEELQNFDFSQGQEKFQELLKRKKKIDKDFRQFSREFKAVAPMRLINEIEKIVL